jgi:hypothetical protein
MAAGSGVQPPLALCGLFDLKPAGEGIAKLIPQVGDLISYCRIRLGLQQHLECGVDYVEVDLTQLVFFHVGTADSSGMALRIAITPAAWRCCWQSFALHHASAA